MATPMDLFNRQLATYEKVVRENYMAHREVYDLLHNLLVSEAPVGFVFMDIACGTAIASAKALSGAPVGRYIGVDNSQPSLDIAAKSLSALSCPVELRCQDFVEAVETWDGKADVIWIGQSLHHLRAAEKGEFMKLVRTRLATNGLFLIWEPTRLEGEDREGWMERFRQVRPHWPAITDEEFTSFDSHHRASDYSETTAAWMDVGRAAGFARAEQIFMGPHQLARVFRFGD